MAWTRVSSLVRSLSPLFLGTVVFGCSADANPGSSGDGGAGGSGGGSSSSAGGAGGGSASSSSSGAGGGSSSSSGSGGGGGSEPVTVPYCTAACQSNADCSMGAAGSAFDADNYACTAGTCEYVGCHSDAECEASFLSPDYVCKSIGAGFASCMMKCQGSADCSMGVAGSAFDADNYACTNGGCQYAGCHTDAECVVTFGQGYVCKVFAAGSVATCAQSCQSAADCMGGAAGGAFDADNYTCTSGGCEYAGCNSDAECAVTFPNETYVCPK
ncbi:hypothetical protein [Polyangium sp. 6x1]|uniref:DUF7478 domain-containing protein n=1 Tax=Polyangium sp. 6x1 TaxID=3042689 RepID=UPI0024829D3E|nr:hypothetical protein [Polyangium sp. 6x1]MDI1444247.1 hypothetical protein [Polyangium sp. 6x1]